MENAKRVVAISVIRTVLAVANRAIALSTAAPCGQALARAVASGAALAAISSGLASATTASATRT
jgi:hypothetical protein